MVTWVEVSRIELDAFHVEESVADPLGLELLIGDSDQIGDRENRRALSEAVGEAEMTLMNHLLVARRMTF